MQNIDSLPLDFFENVTLHPLENRAGRFNIYSDEYFILGYEDKFRGVKKVFEGSTRPFYLLHQETFEITKNIFRLMFKHEPDLITVFHDENKTWNAFILGSNRMTKYESEKEPNLFDTPFSESRFSESHTFEHFPLIGGINNYEQDKNPAFFYLIATPFQGAKGSVLTMDNFRFLKDKEKEPFVNGNRAEAVKKLSKTIADRFEYSESQFNRLLETIAPFTVNKAEFAPIVLDLYNRNRNLQSIRNDSRLKSGIKKLYTEAQNFTFGEVVLPWSEFIHFITRDNQFDLNSLMSLESVEELFSQKLAYQKFETVFKGFATNGRESEEYIASQVDAWLRIEDQIMKSRP